MASDNEATCESDPNFAVICAFLEKFGAACGLNNVDFMDLQDMLENTQEVSQELVELHVKLLRKAKKSVSNERWEKALIKLCHTHCSQDAWEIERFGYKKARISSKLRILKLLLEMQFDLNPRFKTEINKMTANELRSQPLGRDKLGHAYWYQCDENCTVRVYKEDIDEETWTLVAKDREGLLSLISQLSNGDSVKIGTDAIVNEDSSSLEIEKPCIDTGQTELIQQESKTGSESNDVETGLCHSNESTVKEIIDESDNANTTNLEKIEEKTEHVATQGKNDSSIKITLVTHKNKPEVKSTEQQIYTDNEQQKHSENISDKIQLETIQKVQENTDNMSELSTEKELEKECQLDHHKKDLKESHDIPEMDSDGKEPEKENSIQQEKVTITIPSVKSTATDNNNTNEHNEKQLSSTKDPTNGQLLNENLSSNEKISSLTQLTSIEKQSNENHKVLELKAKEIKPNVDVPRIKRTEKTMKRLDSIALNLSSIAASKLENAENKSLEKQGGLDLSKKSPISLRIKPLNELLEAKKETHRVALNVPTFGSSCSSGVGFDNKRSLIADKKESIAKKPRMDIADIMNQRILKHQAQQSDDEDELYDEDEEYDIGDEIEEPVMIIRGEGSGALNKCENMNLESDQISPIIGEEIEEPVMFILGMGSGVDCEGGNEKDTSDKSKSGNSTQTDCQSVNKESSESVNSSKSNETEIVKKPTYKLGTIIDVKSDGSKSSLPKSPLKKSRWDVGKPVEVTPNEQTSDSSEINVRDNNISDESKVILEGACDRISKVPNDLKSTDCDSKTICQNIETQKPEENLKKVSEECIQTSSLLNEDKLVESNTVVDPSTSVFKTPKFFFGPGCVSFKTQTPPTLSGFGTNSSLHAEWEENLNSEKQTNLSNMLDTDCSSKAETFSKMEKIIGSDSKVDDVDKLNNEDILLNEISKSASEEQTVVESIAKNAVNRIDDKVVNLSEDCNSFTNFDVVGSTEECISKIKVKNKPEETNCASKADVLDKLSEEASVTEVINAPIEAISTENRGDIETQDIQECSSISNVEVKEQGELCKGKTAEVAIHADLFQATEENTEKKSEEIIETSLENEEDSQIDNIVKVDSGKILKDVNDANSKHVKVELDIMQSSSSLPVLAGNTKDEQNNPIDCDEIEVPKSEEEAMPSKTNAGNKLISSISDSIKESKFKFESPDNLKNVKGVAEQISETSADILKGGKVEATVNVSDICNTEKEKCNVDIIIEPMKVDEKIENELSASATKAKLDNMGSEIEDEEESNILKESDEKATDALKMTAQIDETAVTEKSVIVSSDVSETQLAKINKIENEIELEEVTSKQTDKKPLDVLEMSRKTDEIKTYADNSEMQLEKTSKIENEIESKKNKDVSKEIVEESVIASVCTSDTTETQLEETNKTESEVNDEEAQCISNEIVEKTKNAQEITSQDEKVETDTEESVIASVCTSDATKTQLEKTSKTESEVNDEEAQCISKEIVEKTKNAQEIPSQNEKVETDTEESVIASVCTSDATKTQLKKTNKTETDGKDKATQGISNEIVEKTKQEMTPQSDKVVTVTEESVIPSVCTSDTETQLEKNKTESGGKDEATQHISKEIIGKTTNTQGMSPQSYKVAAVMEESIITSVCTSNVTKTQLEKTNKIESEGNNEEAQHISKEIIEKTTNAQKITLQSDEVANVTEESIIVSVCTSDATETQLDKTNKTETEGKHEEVQHIVEKVIDVFEMAPQSDKAETAAEENVIASTCTVDISETKLAQPSKTEIDVKDEGCTLEIVAKAPGEKVTTAVSIFATDEERNNMANDSIEMFDKKESACKDLENAIDIRLSSQTINKEGVEKELPDNLIKSTEADIIVLQNSKNKEEYGLQDSILVECTNKKCDISDKADNLGVNIVLDESKGTFLQENLKMKHNQADISKKGCSSLNSLHLEDTECREHLSKSASDCHKEISSKIKLEDDILSVEDNLDSKQLKKPDSKTSVKASDSVLPNVELKIVDAGNDGDPTKNQRVKQGNETELEKLIALKTDLSSSNLKSDDILNLAVTKTGTNLETEKSIFSSEQDLTVASRIELHTVNSQSNFDTELNLPEKTQVSEIKEHTVFESENTSLIHESMQSPHLSSNDNRTNSDSELLSQTCTNRSIEITSHNNENDKTDLNDRDVSKDLEQTSRKVNDDMPVTVSNDSTTNVCKEIVMFEPKQHDKESTDKINKTDPRDICNKENALQPASSLMNKDNHLSETLESDKDSQNIIPNKETRKLAEQQASHTLLPASSIVNKNPEVKKDCSVDKAFKIDQTKSLKSIVDIKVTEKNTVKESCPKKATENISNTLIKSILDDDKSECVGPKDVDNLKSKSKNTSEQSILDNINNSGKMQSQTSEVIHEKSAKIKESATVTTVLPSKCEEDKCLSNIYSKTEDISTENCQLNQEKSVNVVIENEEDVLGSRIKALTSKKVLAKSSDELIVSKTTDASDNIKTANKVFEASTSEEENKTISTIEVLSKPNIETDSISPTIDNIIAESTSEYEKQKDNELKQKSGVALCVQPTNVEIVLKKSENIMEKTKTVKNVECSPIKVEATSNVENTTIKRDEGVSKVIEEELKEDIFSAKSESSLQSSKHTAIKEVESEVNESENITTNLQAVNKISDDKKPHTDELQKEEAAMEVGQELLKTTYLKRKSPLLDDKLSVCKNVTVQICRSDLMQEKLKSKNVENESSGSKAFNVNSKDENKPIKSINVPEKTNNKKAEKVDQELINTDTDKHISNIVDNEEAGIELAEVTSNIIPLDSTSDLITAKSKVDDDSQPKENQSVINEKEDKGKDSSKKPTYVPVANKNEDTSVTQPTLKVTRKGRKPKSVSTVTVENTRTTRRRKSIVTSLDTSLPSESNIENTETAVQIIDTPVPKTASEIPSEKIQVSVRMTRRQSAKKDEQQSFDVKPESTDLSKDATIITSNKRGPKGRNAKNIQQIVENAEKKDEPVENTIEVLQKKELSTEKLNTSVTETEEGIVTKTNRRGRRRKSRNDAEISASISSETIVNDEDADTDMKKPEEPRQTRRRGSRRFSNTSEKTSKKFKLESEEISKQDQLMVPKMVVTDETPSENETTTDHVSDNKRFLNVNSDILDKVASEIVSNEECKIDSKSQSQISGLINVVTPSTNEVVNECCDVPEEKGEPVEESECVKKSVPLLTAIDINKLREENPQHEADEVSLGSPASAASPACDFGGDIDYDDEDSVVDITDQVTATETNANAKSQEKSTSGPTLASFSLDFEEVIPVAVKMPRKRSRTSTDSMDENISKRKKSKRKADESVDDAVIIIDEPVPQRTTRSGRPIVAAPQKPKKKRKYKTKQSAEAAEQADVILLSSEEDKGDSNLTLSLEEAPTDKKEKSREPTPDVEAVKIVQKSPRKKTKRRTLLGLDIPADTDVNKIDEQVCGVRQSRRIAQLKIKEEAERRKLEEIVMDSVKVKSKKKKDDDKTYVGEKSKKGKVVEIYDDTSKEGQSDTMQKKRKKKHKYLKKTFDESNPWKSSSDSSSVEEEEEDIMEYSEEEEEPLQMKSDHEFSPESDLETDAEWLPLKRARTARKESDVEDVDDHACQKCGQTDHPEFILLCDGCDNGWHCSCLRPALFVIPEGDWFCPPCQHKKLIESLQEKLLDFDKKLSRREVEVRRKERLAYVGISLDNVLPAKDKDDKKKAKKMTDSEDESGSGSDSGSSSGSSSSGSSSGSDSDEPIYQLRQRRQAHSYRFNDYDELINSAIQDEMEAVKGAGNQGRGKDINTIINAEKEEKLTEDSAPPVEDTSSALEEPLPPVIPKNTDLPPVVPEACDDSEDDIKPVRSKFIGRKKQRKLNSLDVSSEDDQDSDEDFKGSSSEDEDEDELEEASDSSLDYSGRRRRHEPIRRSTRARVSRYDKEFINDDSDDEPPKRKKKSIWDDDSESEESDNSWGRKKKSKSVVKRNPMPKKKKSKKKKRHSLDESDSEFYHRKKKQKIKYGGLESDEEMGRRTRGKKINFAAVLASDSDEDYRRKPNQKRSDSDDEEYVANEDEIQEAEIENEKDSDENDSNSADDDLPIIKKKTHSRKILDDDDDGNYEEEGINPIEAINKNLEEMDEKEMELMMEQEEFANKKLQQVALQIEKEKRRREREAKKQQKKDKEMELQRQLEEFKKFAEEEQIEAPPDECEKPLDELSNHNLLAPQKEMNTLTPINYPEKIQHMPLPQAQNLPFQQTMPIPPHASSHLAYSMHQNPYGVQHSPNQMQHSPLANLQSMQHSPLPPMQHSPHPHGQMSMQHPQNMQPLQQTLHQNQLPMPPISHPPGGPSHMAPTIKGIHPNSQGMQQPMHQNIPQMQQPLHHRTSPIQQLPHGNPPHGNPNLGNSSLGNPHVNLPHINPSHVNPPHSNIHNINQPTPLPMHHSPTSNPVQSIQASQQSHPQQILHQKLQELHMKHQLQQANQQQIQVQGSPQPIPNVVMSQDQKVPKKRGRKPKGQPQVMQIGTLQFGPDAKTNAELSEPPGVTIPVYGEVPNSDDTPKKRRGRGKGKKTLAAEAAAAAAAGKPDVNDSTTNSSDGKGTCESPDPNSPIHGGKLGIAAPPQPFSQSQPTPSVITRMLQSQPGQPPFGGSAHKYFADVRPPPSEAPNPPLVHHGPFIPGVRPLPPQYRPPGPGMNQFPVIRGGPPGHRLRSPGPQSMHMYHSHSMDPSPSGGGVVAIADRNSPSLVPQSAGSPLSNKGTPPPPPYNRPPGGRFPPVSSTAATTTTSAGSPVIATSQPTQGPPPTTEALPPPEGGATATVSTENTDVPTSQTGMPNPPPVSIPNQQSQSSTSMHTAANPEISGAPPTPSTAISTSAPSAPSVPPTHSGIFASRPPMHLVPPHLRPNMPPYQQPTMPPNFYGVYPPPPNMETNEESLPPTQYQEAPYNEQYGTEGSLGSENSNKEFEEESGGEFGGLVSYFSSQREDDLDG